MYERVAAVLAPRGKVEATEEEMNLERFSWFVIALVRKVTKGIRGACLIWLSKAARFNGRPHSYVLLLCLFSLGNKSATEV